MLSPVFHVLHGFSDYVYYICWSMQYIVLGVDTCSVDQNFIIFEVEQSSLVWITGPFTLFTKDGQLSLPCLSFCKQHCCLCAWANIWEPTFNPGRSLSRHRIAASYSNTIYLSIYHLFIPLGVCGRVMGGKKKKFLGIFIGRHKADLFLKLEFAV